jgi:hypothetical protein
VGLKRTSCRCRHHGTRNANHAAVLRESSGIRHCTASPNRPLRPRKTPAVTTAITARCTGNSNHAAVLIRIALRPRPPADQLWHDASATKPSQSHRINRPRAQRSSALTAVGRSHQKSARAKVCGHIRGGGINDFRMLKSCLHRRDTWKETEDGNEYLGGEDVCERWYQRLSRIENMFAPVRERASVT